MGMRDNYSYHDYKQGVSPAAATTDNTAWVSEIASTVDSNSLTFIGLIGALADADATFTVLVEDGDAANLSDAAAVADSQLIGTEAGAGFDFADDDQVFKIGYIGTKKYVRVTVTPANNTGNAFFAGVWDHGHQRDLPRSTQRQ